jgi:hypothetical protein
MVTSAPSKSKSSKAPSKKGYHLFEEVWVECEKKTKSPTTKKTAKSKKCKASKSPGDKYTVTDVKEDTVVEVELFDPPPAKLVRQHIDLKFIYFFRYLH